MRLKTKVSITLAIFSLSIGLTQASDLTKVKNPFSTSVATVEPVAGTDCKYTAPEKADYNGRFIALRKKGAVAPGEAFETKVYLQNTGNVPWFSSDSKCSSFVVFLGTDKTRDRNSEFYVNDLLWDSSWVQPNRIKMTTKRVDPGQVAEFDFWSKGPANEGYYREYYTPVIEGVTWLDKATFKSDIKVGNPQIKMEEKQYWDYIDKSTDLTKIDLTGEKSIDVSLSAQKMKLKIGDIVVKEFPVSTGSPKHPSPIGTTKITHKQEVRVAGSSPHYIMPKWMTYRANGFGIHALPSLANDHGVFWREALNHIGQPRSHGCIRLLPKDAEFAYNFAEIGTTVIVHR